MKTAVLSVKVDEDVKQRAQAVAGSFGIPLSTLVNAYLMELSESKQVYFSAVEIMTPKMEKIIEDFEAEHAEGDTEGPFDSAKDMIASLES